MQKTSARIILAAITALSLGISTAVVLGGFSINKLVSTIEWAAIAFLAVLVIFGGAGLIALKMASWSDEEEFEELVIQSEQFVLNNEEIPPSFFLDPFDDNDFQAIVAQAIDEMPENFQDVLNKNLAVLISDDGLEHKAYGLYQGDGMARDNYPDRIIIFRDTLRRDFGFNSDLLRMQIIRVVYHEIAHHIGFDEPGVKGLGL
jgi:predicted Zn-dependent protease with MMP-like domain